MKPTSIALQHFCLTAAAIATLARWPSVRGLSEEGVNRSLPVSINLDQNGAQELVNLPEVASLSISNNKVELGKNELVLCQPDLGVLACSKKGDSCQQEEDSAGWYCLPSEDYHYGEDYHYEEDYHLGEPFVSSHLHANKEVITDLETQVYDGLREDTYDSSYSLHQEGWVEHTPSAGVGIRSYRELSPMNICPTPSPKVSADIDFETLVYNCTHHLGGDCPQGFENLTCWDTSEVIDMEWAFRMSYFNGDISTWNVSSVKTMKGMFQETKFNGDISNWDTSGVTDMSFMFSFFSIFKGDISDWDVSSVEDMNNMFWRSWTIVDVTNWDVSAVTDMSEMFFQSYSNDDLSQWDVGSVTTMNSMFSRSEFNRDISEWDVGKVTDMTDMFGYASTFNQDLGDWAFKVPNEVITTDMFRNTSCPIDSDPLPETLPWCRPQYSEAPSTSSFPSNSPSLTPSQAPSVTPMPSNSFSPSTPPSIDCTDDETVEFWTKNGKTKTCAIIAELAKKKSRKRMRKICRKKAFKTGELRRGDFCLETCGKLGFGPGKNCMFISYY